MLANLDTCVLKIKSPVIPVSCKSLALLLPPHVTHPTVNRNPNDLLSVHPCEWTHKKACHQVCNKKGDQHTCSCLKNHEFGRDGRTCVPVHPCETDANGGCQHVCHINGPGVRCSCNKGWKLNEDGKTCEKGKYEHQIPVFGYLNLRYEGILELVFSSSTPM